VNQKIYHNALWEAVSLIWMQYRMKSLVRLGYIVVSGQAGANSASMNTNTCSYNDSPLN